MSIVKEMLNVAKIANSKNDSMLVINRQSGQGTSNDISTNNVIIPGNQIPFSTMQAMYSGSDIARKIASKLPTDALKKGVLVDCLNDELSAELLMQLDDLQAVQNITTAGIWARNFGGCLVIIGIDDGRAPDEPVDFENINEIYSLDAVDRRWAFPITWDDDPMSRNYGQPLTYQVQPYYGFQVKPSIIHRDRLIVCEGLLTTPDEKVKRNWWDLCIYDLILPIINDFNSAYSYAINIMNKSTQGVFKLKNLTEALSGLNADMVQQRWNVVDTFRSIYKSIIIDADTEDFTYQETSLNGWDKMLESYMIRLSAAADMPVTVMMGQSPTGLSATGESDLRQWYSNVKAYQYQYLKPKFEYLVKLLLKAKKVDEPKKWSIIFPDVYESTPSEITAKRTAVATIDKSNIEAGIFSAEEVALFRSEPGGYDRDMTLTVIGKIERDIKQKEKLAAVMANPVQPIKDPEVKEEIKDPAENEIVDETASLENKELQLIRNLASKMTELGFEKCAHNRANYCPNCKISKTREPMIDEDGNQSFKTTWHATSDLEKPHKEENDV